MNRKQWAKNGKTKKLSDNFILKVSFCPLRRSSCEWMMETEVFAFGRDTENGII